MQGKFGEVINRAFVERLVSAAERGQRDVAHRMWHYVIVNNVESLDKFRVLAVMLREYRVF